MCMKVEKYFKSGLGEFSSICQPYNFLLTFKEFRRNEHIIRNNINLLFSKVINYIAFSSLKMRILLVEECLARTMSLSDMTGRTCISGRHQSHGADGDPTQLFRTMIVAMRPRNCRWATQLELLLWKPGRAMLTKQSCGSRGPTGGCPRKDIPCRSHRTCWAWYCCGKIGLTGGCSLTD
jgi:hypothetical protein